MKKVSLGVAMIPVVVLIVLLALNVYIFEADATSGSNQFALLLAAAVAALIGVINGVNFSHIMERVAHNIQATAPAILILLLVGSLAGTWLISGIVPAMIYYGLQILTPTIFFLPVC